MKTLVIQSYRTTNVPAWIARCMDSVQLWAKEQGYDYYLADDDTFSLCGDEYLAKVGPNVRSITNLSRLLLTQNALNGDYEHAIWLDADVFIFDRVQFKIPATDRYAFARETWLDFIGDGRWTVFSAVNNCAFIFRRGEPDLQFLIDATRHVALHRTVRTNYQVGGDLLKGLKLSLDFKTIGNVGMFSSFVVRAIGADIEEIISAQARFHNTPVHAANLCASTNYQAPVTMPEVTAAMDALERSRGAIVNRWLSKGPLQPQPYPGRTTILMKKGGEDGAANPISPLPP